MTERAAPYYCPYCGEQDLRPQEGPAEDGYAWYCGDCARVFRVRFVGLRAAAVAHRGVPGDEESGDTQ